MAQIEQSDNGGKKKKGAQKKIAIHVDFTPMVDMNMLLITFFMLCTTMIKSQTLQLILPTNEEVKKENQNQAKKSEAVTLILDTEYNVQSGTPVVDENGKTAHIVYYYTGIADTTFSTPDFLKKETFIGNQNGQPQGIRAILVKRNEAVMKEYLKLKEMWKNEEISKEQFDSLAKLNAADSLKTRPVVVIKPGPNTTYEGLVNALDEMQINQISRYSIETPTHTDTILLNEYNRRNPAK
ncbi:MAG: biopolymer transporter ExbD [Muribaculaceae bacterium]|nr:biopolymer transporter ExbD [Muribaculaceae bacterium]